MLVQWEDVFHVVPASRASDLRADPSYESVLRHSTVRWQGAIPPEGLLEVLRSPEKEYGDIERNAS